MQINDRKIERRRPSRFVQQAISNCKTRANIALSQLLMNLRGALSSLDLPQVDLMNFRVEYVRPRNGRCLGREEAERATGTEGLFRKSISS